MKETEEPPRCKKHNLVIDKKRYPYGGGCKACSYVWARKVEREDSERVKAD